MYPIKRAIVWINVLLILGLLLSACKPAASTAGKNGTVVPASVPTVAGSADGSVATTPSVSRGALPEDEPDAPVVRLIADGNRVIHAAVADYDELLSTTGLPIFVDYWSVTCPPCRAAAPFIEQLAGDYEGRAVILKVSLDARSNAELGNRYRIDSIPLFQVIKNGKVVERQVGYSAALQPALRQMIDRHLG